MKIKKEILAELWENEYPKERIHDLLVKQPDLAEFILKFKEGDRLMHGLFLMYLAIENTKKYKDNMKILKLRRKYIVQAIAILQFTKLEEIIGLLKDALFHDSINHLVEAKRKLRLLVAEDNLKPVVDGVLTLLSI